MGFIQTSLFSLLSRSKRAATRRRSRSRPGRIESIEQRASDSALKQRWDSLIESYFPERRDLKEYEVSWSRRRQRRTLGSCNMSKRRVRMAAELNHPDFERWIEPVLYHELCHAVLGTEVFSHCGKRAWHGQAFRQLEARHPDTAALDTWMRTGGWASAVRSARSRAMWKARR